LTKSTTFIIGPIAQLLGYLMQGIFNVLDAIGIPNIGLSIIIFTLITNFILLPFTIKQQKFSKLQMRMQPELKVIDAKYKNKKDQQSQQAKMAEQNALYVKYGVSPAGSCVQLFIQMPILFSLYQIIYNVPAYVPKVKDAFLSVVDKLILNPDSLTVLENFKNFAAKKKIYTGEEFLSQLNAVRNSGNLNDTAISSIVDVVRNRFVDILNNASKIEWASITDSLGISVDQTLETLNKYNYFLGLDIANSPMYLMTTGWADKNFLLILASVILPILSAATQWINVKLMPQAQTNTSDDQNSMASSMKTMNNVMPIMSAVFCFTLPAGLGLYWVAGSVVRSVFQVIINRHLDNMNIEEIIAKAAEKNKNKKRFISPKAQPFVNESTIAKKASIQTKAISVVSSDKLDHSNQKASDSIDNHKNKNNVKVQSQGDKLSISQKAKLVSKFDDN